MAAANEVSSGGAKQAPRTDTAPAPQNAPKKPEDNTAAKQAPKETRTAVGNTFGPVQQKHTKKDKKESDSGSKSPANGAKDSAGDAKSPADGAKAPAGDTKAPAGDTKAPAGDTKAPASDAKAPDGGAKTPAGDPKAPDSGAKVPADDTKSPASPESAPVTDAKGEAVKTPDNRRVILDKHNNPIPVESDGKPTTDPKGNIYAVNNTGKYLETPDGKYVVYERTSNNLIATDPLTGETVADKGGNPYYIDKQGDYVQTPEGDAVVYDMNGNTVAAGKDGKPFADKHGDPFMVLGDGKYAKAGNNDVVYSKQYGNQSVAVDPGTGETVKDAYGNPLAVDQGGKFLKTPDGKEVVYDKSNGGKRTFVDPATGKIAADANGNPFAVSPDGRYTTTPEGNYVVHDRATGDNLVAIDGKTGQPIVDGKGRPLAIDDYGNAIKTPDGNTVVYEKFNNKFNPVAVDANGDPLVFNGNPAVVDKNGNFVKAADGNNVVYDAKGNPVAQNKDGKIVTDKNGNPLVLDKRGKYMPGVVYEQQTGFKTPLLPNGDIMTRPAPPGAVVAVDESGKPIIDSRGVPAIYDSRGNTVMLHSQTPDGFFVYKDMKTDELVSTSPGGPVYKIDPATMDFAKDADGNPLPALYDPVNSDQTRPPVKPNGDVRTTLENLPQGKERGDPMAIKDELFDKNSNLDVDKLMEAAAKYDPRDVYNALINAGKSGGWDNLDVYLPSGAKLAQPNEAQSREAIAALIAWQNANGKYDPLRKGELPPVVYYQGGNGNNEAPSSDSAAYVSVTPQSEGLASRTYHELNYARASEAFQEAYNHGVSLGANTMFTPAVETITEYLANDWTGDTRHGNFDQKHPEGLKELEQAVVKMGNGDRNAGMDILKRAYFSGDVLALRKLKEAFPPDRVYM